MTVQLQIDGATRLFAIIGDPVDKARSPAVYTELFAQRRIPAVMIPLHVLEKNIESISHSLELIQNLDGILVTAPFKSTLVKLCKSLGPAAECVGAVNALRRLPGGGWHGDLFDGAGFVAGAQSQGILVGGRKVLQFGAGGAGSAIAYALAAAGVSSLRLIDPQTERVSRLCSALKSRFTALDIREATAHAEPFDMVINASTVGFGGSPGLPGDIAPLKPGMAVGEVNVTPEGTELVRMAKAAGLAWCDGRHLHTGQIEQILGFFFGHSKV